MNDYPIDPSDWIARKRTEADYLRALHQETAARVLEATLEELRQFLRGWQEEELTLKEAARESHLTARTIRRHVERGDLAPVTTKPLTIRRCDIPGWTWPGKGDGGPLLDIELGPGGFRLREVMSQDGAG